MNIKDDTLYILVKGEPNSPEVESFGRLLSSDINTVNYEFIEIGGSGNFNTVAKLIYNKVKNRENSIHKVIPVLAIADRDFRKYSSDDEIADNLLIERNKAKIIYWERHEWENFLLDELDVITSFLNQLPDKSSNNKPTKQVITQVTEEFVNNFLLQYFQSQIQTEFIECIRFRFLHSDKSYSKLEAPKNITGKEAFVNLLNYLSNEFKIYHLNENRLKERILRDLENRKESILVSQINKLLSPYLEKDRRILE
jgi:hypothetical protein